MEDPRQDLDKKLSRLERSLLAVHVKLERHAVLHEKNTEDLREHMKRTEANEKQIDLLRRMAWILFGGVLASSPMGSPVISYLTELLK